MPVTREVDLYFARLHARELAGALGFDRYGIHEAETAVSEITTNVLHHGIAGTIVLRRTPDAFEFTCTDRGPGFPQPPDVSDNPPQLIEKSVERVRSKSHNPRGGLGAGLAGARRLMGELSTGRSDEGGALIYARKEVPRTHGEEGQPKAFNRDRWNLAVVSAPADGQKTCGDGFTVCEADDSVLIGVVDGLGHGEGAHDAARTILRYADEHSHLSLPEIATGAHDQARTTRGGVACFARLSASGVSACTFTSIGNIEGAVLPRGERLLCDSGCIGVHLPSVRERSILFQRGDTLTLWSDGIERPPTSWPYSLVPSVSLQVLERHAKVRRNPRDDALILAVWRS